MVLDMVSFGSRWYHGLRLSEACGPLFLAQYVDLLRILVGTDVESSDNQLLVLYLDCHSIAPGSSQWWKQTRSVIWKVAENSTMRVS